MKCAQVSVGDAGPPATADVPSTHEYHGEKLVRGPLETSLVGTDEGDNLDAAVLGVCHRPGCSVPDTGCAKTLTGHCALKRHVEVSCKEPRWLPNVRQVKFRGFITQHSQGTVELEWDEAIHFVAHVVPGTVGLLLSRSDALGATIDLKTDHLHLESPRATLKLSTTPAGHYDIDFLKRNSETAIGCAPATIPGSTVLAKNRHTSQGL